MDLERASVCVEQWKANYEETMRKIRESQDTTDLDKESLDMLHSLFEEANLPGHKKNFN